MDFALLPPEVNSARMYAGPGAGPMLAAAAAWDGLAADLESTAASYLSAVSGLTSGAWLGPSSAAMAAAAAPYVTWMSATATQAAQAATQAKMAAGAYEAAFAMTVPPPVIAANRSLLMSLLATNFLGQNTAAIATTEAQHMEMWAQDAAAMYGYAGQSATASTLTPFSPAPSTTNPTALLSQAGGVTQSAGIGGAYSSTVMSAVSQALQSLAAPAAPAASLINLLPLLAIPAAAVSSVAIAASSTSASASFTSVGYTSTGIDTNRAAIAINADRDFAEGNGPFTGDGPGAGLLPEWLGGQGAPSPVAALPVTAGTGQGTVVGGLSVPPAWATAAPAMRTVARAVPLTSESAAPALMTGTSGNLFSELALAGMAGRAMGGTVGPGPRERVQATTRERAQFPQRSPDGPTTGIAAELRELADLHNSGNLTDEEFTDAKRRAINR